MLRRQLGRKHVVVALDYCDETNYGRLYERMRHLLLKDSKKYEDGQFYSIRHDNEKRAALSLSDCTEGYFTIGKEAQTLTNDVPQAATHATLPSPSSAVTKATARSSSNVGKKCGLSWNTRHIGS